ncbi:3D domain-containing protein [Hungatella effluvii]|nr:3D domain-containing protein [Hungatella effluvii]
MGTKVEIGGIVYTVEDTGESVTGNVIDIYFDTHEEAVRFGRQRKEVYLVQ